MKTVQSFTLHNVEPDLYSALLSRAHAQGTSLNRFAKALLRTASGLTVSRKKRDLSWLQKHTLTKDDARALDRAIRETETIVPGDW